MVSFYPGPSEVYAKVPRYVADAHTKGVLSLNHRSPQFETLCRETVQLLKEKLNIPTAYTVVFTTSATECWEIIAQSLIERSSTHVYNGAFGGKWFDYTRRLHPEAQSASFDYHAPCDPDALIFDFGEAICLTQNETSNGTQLSNRSISTIKKNNPSHLICVDATSSMAGIRLNFDAADVWFASVQKCFGLPAGLAVMVLSPKAVQIANTLNENRHYNSLTFLTTMMAHAQTNCTPNVMGIYLLMRTLKDRKDIDVIQKQTADRADAWYSLFRNNSIFKPLTSNKSLRSQTVIALTGDPTRIAQAKVNALKKGYLLGEGYGTFKRDTFRIANFPALPQTHVERLQKLFAAGKI